MTSKVKSISHQAAHEWAITAAHPALWATAALVILITQTGYWFDVSWEPRHSPADPAALLARATGIMGFWCPMIAILCMAAATHGPRPHQLNGPRLARNITAVLVALTLIALASALFLLPGGLIANLVYPWNHIQSSQPETLLPSLVTMGKALWIGAAYASFAAMVITITGSRVAGALLAIPWALLEAMTFDIAVTFLAFPEWINGLLPSHMYRYWLGDPSTTLGSMHNILGLQDGPQAFLVLGGHLAFTATATLSIAKLKRRLQSRKNQEVVQADSPDQNTDQRPDPKRWKYAAITAAAIVLIPTGVGATFTATGDRPTPKQIAERHIRLNLNETARQVAQAAAPGHPKKDLITEEFRSSMANSLTAYECENNDRLLKLHTKLGVSCTVSAPLVKSLNVYMTVPMTVTVLNDHSSRRGKPKITGVQIHREGIIKRSYE